MYGRPRAPKKSFMACLILNALLTVHRSDLTTRLKMCYLRNDHTFDSYSRSKTAAVKGLEYVNICSGN